MNTPTFKGTHFSLVGDLPMVGGLAPDFTLTTSELIDRDIDFFENKIKLLNIFPSLDTDICAASVVHFNKVKVDPANTVILHVSMDLPFAAKRFCKTKEITNTLTLSAFRTTFPEDYGVLIADGPLAGLCTRAVIVLDRSNVIRYVELVPEITLEPSYDKAVGILENLCKL